METKEEWSGTQTKEGKGWRGREHVAL